MISAYSLHFYSVEYLQSFNLQKLCELGNVINLHLIEKTESLEKVCALHVLSN